MKKFGIMVVVLAMLVGMTGFAMADPGVNATPETIGVGTVTVAQVQGSMISKTDVSITAASSQALTTIPAPTAGTYYASTYNEDTVSNGVGIIEYTKTMDVDTMNMLANQYNIEAFKSVAFLGDGTSNLVTTENIFVDGTGMPLTTSEALICTLGSAKSSTIPAFCNVAEAGSTVDMLVGLVTTTTNDRFIMASGDPGVELNHNLRVQDTVGSATAYIEVFSQEAKGSTLAPFTTTRIEETTTVDGLITLFDKEMSSFSSFKR